MKQVSVYFLLMAFSLLINTGCSNKDSSCRETHKDSAAAFDLPAIKKIIEEKNKKFTNAHITGDTAFLNNIFTKDAKVFAPNTEVVTGHAAISALNKEWVNYDIKEFREESTDLYGNEELLVDEGSYFFLYGKDNTIDKGKYINIWKKEDGEWKIHSNIWNTNLPATASN